MSERKQSVFIDFDQTISPIHGFDIPPELKTVNAITALHAKYKIVIYSCRANLEVCDHLDYVKMLRYLDVYNIPYDSVRRDKPLFNYIIDDRSYNPLRTSWDDILKDLVG